ncbi:uncharacterized protein IWZ02DRAFT_444298 [Phyllosticta citriasiana]|uniref:uncharacterized protein n=1 Tax=Phyllosticta citriasiana TaxID=595635 RepID=UPI0030FD9CF5
MGAVSSCKRGLDMKSRTCQVRFGHLPQSVLYSCACFFPVFLFETGVSFDRASVHEASRIRLPAAAVMAFPFMLCSISVSTKSSHALMLYIPG